MLYSLQIALSTYPAPPRPKAEPAKEAPKKAETMPDDPDKLELWARTFIEGIDIQRNPSKPVDPNSFFAYAGDLLPNDGKVYVGHSC